jgi:hypothetical protein
MILLLVFSRATMVDQLMRAVSAARVALVNPRELRVGGHDVLKTRKSRHGGMIRMLRWYDVVGMDRSRFCGFQ